MTGRHGRGRTAGRRGLLRWPLVALAALVALVTSGCSTQRVFRAEGYSPLVARRVAVLPFLATYRGPGLPTEAYDSIPLIGEAGETGEGFFRRALAHRLRAGASDVLSPVFVDATLRQAGFYDPDTGDYGFLHLSPQDLGRLFRVDAILLGEVARWEIDYYGVETRYRIEVETRLIDTSTGETLADAKVRRQGGAGLSGGPTGYYSAIMEPIRGLSAGRLMELARDVAEELAAPFLPGEADLIRAMRRAPLLHYATHDLPTGRQLRPGRVVTILARGEAGMEAIWSLDGDYYTASMTEADPGVYLAKFDPPEGLTLRNAVVTVTLINAEGFRSSLDIRRKPLTMRPTD